MFSKLFRGGKEQSAGTDLLKLNESKLDQVRGQLQSNQAVIVAGEVINTVPHGYWSEQIDIFVAPARPIFGAAKLNRFMDKLIKGIEPTSTDEVQDHTGEGPGGLTVGVLYFDEQMDPNFSQKGQRRTRIRIFPKANIAWLASEVQNAELEGTLDERTDFGLTRLQFWITGPEMELVKKHDSLINTTDNQLLK